MSDLRRGRFWISHVIVYERPEMAHSMLSNMLVVRAESHYDRAAIEYTAYCDDFDEVEPGNLSPMYEAAFQFRQIQIDGETLNVEEFDHWARMICERS